MIVQPLQHWNEKPGPMPTQRQVIFFSPRANCHCRFSYSYNVRTVPMCYQIPPGPSPAAPALLVKQLEQHSQRCSHEVDEARLSDSSLPTGHIALPLGPGPIALPALGRSRPGLNNPTWFWWDTNPRPSDLQSEALTTHCGGWYI